MPHRTRRQIVIFALLIVKLCAMDFAVLPVAHAAARGDAAAPPAHHCAEMTAKASAHAEELAASNTSSVSTQPGDETHHGCHSAECKCSCTHAPAVVAAVTFAVACTANTGVLRFGCASPASGGVSALFRPPI